MKKLSMFLTVALIAASGFAGLADNTFSNSVVGAGTTTVSRALNGFLEAVHINVAPATTQNVTIASTEATLYANATVTDDTWLLLRYPANDSTGAAINNTTNSSYWRYPLKGTISVTVVGANGAATTNATVTKFFYYR